MIILADIYEKYDQKSQFKSIRSRLIQRNSRRADFYISKYRQLKSEYQKRLEQDEEIEKLYRCERDKKG